MTTFDKREEGFEKKFALDEEQKFKAEARRNKLLGQWVAEKLGNVRRCRHRLCQGSGRRRCSRSGDGDVLRKVLGDIKAKGVDITEQQIRAKMDELMAVAIAQVKAGT